MAEVNIQQLLTDTLKADANIRIAAELKLSDVLQRPGEYHQPHQSDGILTRFQRPDWLCLRLH